MQIAFRTGLGLVASMLTLGTACTLNPNGTTVSGNPIGRTVSLTGFVFTANQNIRIQVLDPADQDPDDSAATWTTLTTVQSAATPLVWQGDDMFGWSASVVPVPNAGEINRWRDGGLARFRALDPSNNRLATFDDDGCLSAGISAGDSYVTIFNNCKSHDMPVLTFVDEDPVAASSEIYLTRRSNAAVEGGQYNAAISAPATLAAYKATRGFPAGEIVAKYYNKGDLGIGREMHCRARGAGRVSCYVTNYGDPTDGLADASSATTDTINGVNHFATVAMDYYPGPATNQVRFYTYNGADNIVTAAELDSEGAKPTPGLCLSCHGGSYNAATNSVTGAKFLPFDLDAFSYSGSAPWRKSDQQESFRRLNALIKTANPGASSTTLIDGWYASTGGVSTVGATQDSDWVPPAWTSEKILYLKAVKPYCRTCHVSVGFPMDTPAQFKAYGIENAVCDGKYMPHAEVTRKSFWQSSARAHIAGALNLSTDCD